MAGYRITVRSLDSRLVGERVLKEITDLEECARMDGGEVAAPAVSGRFVFVLEESDEELAPARDGRPK